MTNEHPLRDAHKQKLKALKKIMKPFFAIILIWILFMGCAPNIKQLDEYLTAGNYERAAEMVKGDPIMQRELAAMVLEKAAGDPSRSFEHVGALIRAGKPGKRALERLALSPAKMEGRMAAIGLRRHRKPSPRKLAGYMDDDSSDVRALAAGTWYKHMTGEALKRQIVDIDPRVRTYAIAGLCLKKDWEETATLVREALRLDPDAKVRAKAAACGHCLGPDSLMLLKSGLSDENMGVRLSIIQGLVKTKNTSAIAVVTQLAKGPLDEMAIAAAAELARINQPIGLERLQDALGDHRPSIRVAAMLRLQRGKVDKQKQILMGLLTDKSPEVSYRAAQFLFKDPKASKQVMETLDRIALETPSYAEKTRDLLAQMGNQEAISSIIDSPNNSDKDSLIKTISRTSKVEELKNWFTSLISNNDEDIRIAAARAILEL
jgi:hypothetical protein